MHFSSFSHFSEDRLRFFNVCVLIWISTNRFLFQFQWLDDLILTDSCSIESGPNRLFHSNSNDRKRNALRGITKRLWWITRKEIWISNRVHDWHVHTRAEIVEIIEKRKQMWTKMIGNVTSSCHHPGVCI